MVTATLVVDLALETEVDTVSVTGTLDDPTVGLEASRLDWGLTDGSLILNSMSDLVGTSFLLFRDWTLKISLTRIRTRLLVLQQEQEQEQWASLVLPLEAPGNIPGREHCLVECRE